MFDGEWPGGIQHGDFKSEGAAGHPGDHVF